MYRQPTAAQISRLVRHCTASRYARASNPSTVCPRLMLTLIEDDVQEALKRREARLYRYERGHVPAADAEPSDVRALQPLWRAANNVTNKRAATYGWGAAEAMKRMDEWVNEAMAHRAERRQHLGLPAGAALCMGLPAGTAQLN